MLTLKVSVNALVLIMKLTGLKDVGCMVIAVVFIGIAILQEVILVLPMIHASKRARLHMHSSVRRSVNNMLMPIIIRGVDITLVLFLLGVSEIP